MAEDLDTALANGAHIGCAALARPGDTLVIGLRRTDLTVAEHASLRGQIGAQIDGRVKVLVIAGVSALGVVAGHELGTGSDGS